MRKKRQPERKSRFTQEQKAEALAMIETGDLTAQQVADSYGVTTRTLRNWRRQLQAVKEATPLSGAERRKLEQLERENKELKLQLEIQKKFRTFARKHRP
jgi:transposase-like protein